MGGAGAAALFLPLPYAWVWAQSEGVIRLLKAPKVALVLGNSNYKSVPALRNPANDAAAIAEVLKGFGFAVTLKLDGILEDMQAATRTYIQLLDESRGVGLFYYAGHGLQLSWTNFLVPVDAAIRKVEDVQTRCVDLSGLMHGLRKATNPMNIIILDACRENPFERDFKVSNRGLTQMDTPNDTLLAYATAPGNVASDGEGANGLYTEVLLKEIRTPETRVEDVFKRVRLNVRRRTRGAQVPWESTSLEEDFWFIPPRQFAPSSEDRTGTSYAKLVRTESKAHHAVEAKTRAWANAGPRRVADAQDRRTAEAEAARKARAEERAKRERAERESPESEKKFRQELARWERIKDSRDPDDFYEFLLERPSGYLSELAQFRLDQLEAPKAQVQPGADGIKQLPSGVNRFALGDVFEYDNIDRYTNLSRRIVYLVTYADNDRVEFNGGAMIYNQMGGVLFNPGGKKEPIYLRAPAELARGKRWRTAFTNTRPDGVVENAFWDYHVIGLEDVTVPAGTFKAYKVAGEGLARYQDGATNLSELRWINPATMDALRGEVLFRTSRGAVVDYRIYLLVSAKRVPR